MNRLPQALLAGFLEVFRIRVFGGGQRAAKDEQSKLNSTRGPIRNFLESVGMAVLMAVLLKYFALEAYVIPTPSMQPTMMGSPESGKSDRILVDKIHYLLHEPERWDSAVFRYPARQHQSYVKRIVGVGPEKLRIAAGDLHRVAADGESFELLPKPARIHEQLWREIYPMRLRFARYRKNQDPDAFQEAEVFRNFFRVTNGRFKLASDGAWDVQPGKARVNLKNTMATNLYSDGYSLAVAKDYFDAGKDAQTPPQGVRDLRIGFSFEGPAPEELLVEIRNNEHGRRYQVQIAKGKATLSARKPGAEEPLSSAARDFSLGPDPTHLRFALLDGHLYLWRDDELCGESFDVRTICNTEDIEAGKVEASIQIRSQGRSKLRDVKVERDLCYTRSQLPADHLIEVEAGHYFMMGDNTLGSADSRDWKELRIGVDADGYLVDPEVAPEARVLWGNLRPKSLAEMPHYDDNPVVTADGKMVFEDTVGQIHLIKMRNPKHLDLWGQNFTPNQKAERSRQGLTSLRTSYTFDVDGRRWTPKTRPKSLVPRAHIQGRPIARFLRDLWALEFTGWIR